MCPILKKLSKKLQPFREVMQVLAETLISKKVDSVRVLEHLLSYAEYQFGKEVKGLDYREREDGERFPNWKVDIIILHEIHSKITDIYVKNGSSSRLVQDAKMFPHLEKSLSLLSPWMADSNSNTSQLNYVLKNNLLQESYIAEKRMAMITMERSKFDVAEGHCERCLRYARQFKAEGKDKTTAIFSGLKNYIHLRRREGKISIAVTFAEEAYNLVVVAYDPVHSEVQEAAGELIKCLMETGNFVDAERYAEVTYSNLRDRKNGINQESEMVAEGAYNFADILQRSDGDLKKAEGLAREALRIRTKLFGPGDNYVAITCILLARILRSQNNFGNETKNLLEQALTNFIKNEGTTIIPQHYSKFKIVRN
jgi:hypothetical protein